MKASAGILLYRKKGEAIEVLVVHPGGPFWAKKDDGVWSFPKGQVEEEEKEDMLETAKREFKEETGFEAPSGEYIELGEVFYPRKDKKILAWATEGDLEAEKVKSNTFEMEWPPRSGKKQKFPEIDRAAWCNLEQALVKLFYPHHPLLERLAAKLNVSFDLPKPKEEPQQGSLF